jgi:hypothetical protein
MRMGISLGITGNSRAGEPPIITAIVSPALGSLQDGDAISSALSANIDDTANYASSEGTIASVDLVVTVNAAPAVVADVVDYNDHVLITVTVTDDAANERVFNLGGTVVGIIPANTAAPSIAGDTELGDVLTVTPGTWTGVPTPSLSYQWRRDGVAISGATGSTYTIVIADNGADIDVLETATNVMGAVSEASNAITVDTFTAPNAFTAPDWGVANDGTNINLNITTLPADGGSPILDIEYRLNGGSAVSTGETTTGSYTITAVEDDDIQIRATNAIGNGAWSDTKTVPSGIPANAIRDRATNVINDRAGSPIETRS